MTPFFWKPASYGYPDAESIASESVVREQSVLTGIPLRRFFLRKWRELHFSFWIELLILMLAHCAIVRCEYSAGSIFRFYVFQNRRKSGTGGKLSRIPRHENGTFFWKEVKIMEAAVKCSISRKNGTKPKKSTSFFRPFCFIITMKGLWIERILFPSY